MCFRLSTEPIWIADEAGLEHRAVRDALTADLIVDAIAGTSFKPPLDKLAGKAVTAINDAFGTVVCVDVPSGVDADSNIPRYESSDDAVFAHGIITFIGPKPAHIFGELTSGPMAVSEIGVQPALVPNQIGLAVVTGQEVGITFPPRLPGAHKGQLCHVLVIAGSRGQAGAAGLAGMAKSIEAVVSGFAPELLTASLEETSEGTISMEAGGQLESLMKGKDVVVLGPGLSANEETRRFVRRLVEHCSVPLVLDAGGVNAFEGHYDELKSTSGNFRVLTLQLAEAARLLGISISDTEANRTAVARRVSNEASSCVVLKGSRTVVAGLSGETWFNLTGGSALAKSGSDDVLSGMIGAALAQHARSQIKDDGDQRSPGNANQASAFLNDIRVAAAVHLHGLAGDMARDTLHENTILATDILESLTDAFRDCDLQMERRLFYLHK
jgi:NAD(P)H-hydrate epimerase